MKKTIDALSPEVRSFLEQFSEIHASMEHLSIPEQRQQIKKLFLLPKDRLDPVEHVEDRYIQGKHGAIPLRIIMPKGFKNEAIVFFHRGGWVYGSIDESENLCRKIANRTERVVVQVDYRLSPENKFPVPLEDGYDAVCWASSHLRLGNRETPIVVCGESAGGNLAAAVALLARNEQGPNIAAQVLIYPVLSNQLILERYERSPDKHLLSYDTMKWFWEQYLTSPEEGNSDLASPLNVEDVTGLPRAMIMTAEYDALWEEGWEYAEKLKRGGVEVVYKQYSKVIHGFLDLPLSSPEIQKALNDLSVFLSS